MFSLGVLALYYGDDETIAALGSAGHFERFPQISTQIYENSEQFGIKLIFEKYSVTEIT